MESLLANFDIDNKKNFWKLYPSWKTPRLFRELHKNDKSKDKTKSSDIMWGLAHMYDKTEHNPFKDVDEDELHDLINLDVLDDEDFDWSKYEEHMALTERLMLTDEEKEFLSFKRFMERRRKLIEEEEKNISLDKLKDLDDARKRNQLNMVEYNRLKDIVENKKIEGKTKGDIIESALEKGEI